MSGRSAVLHQHYQDGKVISVIGVYDKYGEAVHIVALEDGTNSLGIGGENGRLMIGMSKKDR